MGYPQTIPTSLWCDNQAAIRLVMNSELHKRSKHVDIAYHKIREFQEDAQLQVKYIHTDNQIADIFTKPLTPEKFRRFRSLLNLAPSNIQFSSTCFIFDDSVLYKWEY
jgi:hypothetical protein